MRLVGIGTCGSIIYQMNIPPEAITLQKKSINQLFKLTIATFFLFAATVCLFPASAAQVIQEPVGPRPANLKPPTSQGYLVVYTPTETVDDGDVYYYPHTGYTVYTPKDDRVKSVLNRNSVHDEQPQKVALPVGTYKVKTEFKTIITVVIEAGKTTTVNLDDSTSANISKANANAVVKNQDGKIIGWKAHASSN